MTPITRLRLSGPAVAIILLGALAVQAASAGPAPGDQRRWTLHFRAQLEQSGQEQPDGVELQGEWVSTVTAVGAGEYEAALELANARLSSDAARSARTDGARPAQPGLARRFWATYRNDGALLAIHFFKDVDASDRNLLQMIATEAQLLLPDASRPVWNVMERDGAGSYLAIYNRLGPNVVVKRKLKYMHTDGAPDVPADGVRVDVERSELRFSMDPDGGILGLDGQDRLRMGVPFGNAGQVLVGMEIHLSNLRKSYAPELIGSLERSRLEVVSSPIVTHKLDPGQVRAQLDQRLLEGHSTESLLEAALAKEAEPTLPDRLAALFRRRPDAIPEARETLRKDGPCRRITNALGSAGSPAAIDALGKLARDSGVVAEARVDAITALVGIQHPGATAMRIAAAMLDDPDARVAHAARLMTGALARAGRAEHPEDAARLDEALITRYRKSRDGRERSDLLAALGNSVGPAVLPLIEKALGDPRESVRAAAARGLRLAPGPEVDRLLSGTITSDQAPAVRAAAIFAATFRHPVGPQIGEALVRAASADPVDYVRGSAVALLRHNPDASPRIPETLAWIAENDAKPGIRRLAREALDSVSH